MEPGDSSDEDAEAAADAKAFVNQIKNITGLWDDDPDEVRGGTLKWVGRSVGVRLRYKVVVVWSSSYVQQYGVFFFFVLLLCV